MVADASMISTWFCGRHFFCVFDFWHEDIFLFWRVGLVGRGAGCCRGLDYPGVTAVIQLGAPDSRHEYVHRVGRTGRAAAEGGWGGGNWRHTDLESLFSNHTTLQICQFSRWCRWDMLLCWANDDEMILNPMLPIAWQVQHLNHISPCKYGRRQEELSLQ